MAEKVKLSKDGSSIDFVQSDSIPTSLKKFRQSPEIEGFYRFIYENDLRAEAFDILDRIVQGRKAKKSAEKAAVKEREREEREAVKAASKAAKEAEKMAVKAAKEKEKLKAQEQAAAKAAKEAEKKIKAAAKQSLAAKSAPAKSAKAPAKTTKAPVKAAAPKGLVGKLAAKLKAVAKKPAVKAKKKR